MRRPLLPVVIMALAASAAQAAPPFADYPVAVKKVEPRDPDFTSKPSQGEGFIRTPPFSRYRTVIRQAMKGGVNFAGHYVMAIWGCGTQCSEAVIIDAKTGRIYGYLNASLGFAFEPGSRLLVKDAQADDATRKAWPDIEPSYWLWDGKRLDEVKAPISTLSPE